MADLLLRPIDLARQQRAAHGQKLRPDERRQERRRSVQGNETEIEPAEGRQRRQPRDERHLHEASLSADESRGQKESWRGTHDVSMQRCGSQLGVLAKESDALERGAHRAGALDEALEAVDDNVLEALGEAAADLDREDP